MLKRNPTLIIQEFQRKYIVVTFLKSKLILIIKTDRIVYFTMGLTHNGRRYLRIKKSNKKIKPIPNNKRRSRTKIVY